MIRTCFAVALLAVAVPATAQDNLVPTEKAPFVYLGNELVIGHGLLPSAQLFSGLGNARYSNNSVTGVLFATYRYHFTKVISVGVTAAFEHESGTWAYRNAPRAPAPVFVDGSFSRNCYTVAPEVTFNYFDDTKGIVRLYSVAGIGYTHRTQNFTWNNPNGLTNYPDAYIPNPRPDRVHIFICPLGIRVGRALAGFAEFGVGYKGLFNYGMSYRF
jgi:hypothetical protein